MKRYSLTETAKLIRAELAQKWPSVKFSVRSKSYSGGCSITAAWTDGPTTAQVKPILDQFEGASFDGLVDLKSYNKPTEYKGEQCTFAPDYVFTARNESAELVRKVADRVAYECGVATPEVAEGGYVKDGNFAVPFVWHSHWLKTPFITVAELEAPGHLLVSDRNGRGEYLNNLIHAISQSVSAVEAL